MSPIDLDKMYPERTAMITGITGQDGSYLAEFLLAKGYTVHGIIRRSSSLTTGRINQIYQAPQDAARRLFLHYGDLSDGVGMMTLINQINPNEIYNLAAQSHVRASFDIPVYTGEVTGLGTTSLLEAIRSSGSPIRFFQASSSEMFGASPPPQFEETSFCPRSPYAVAKLYSHWMTKNYREAYGIFAVNGIMFNHESPRRGETFVTRKISAAVVKIKNKEQESLALGNLSARRDWGYAPEYVDAMWRMLQIEDPTDFVIATNTSYSVEDFCRLAFEQVGLNWREYVKFDKRYLRPTEVDDLRGDYALAKAKLGWYPKVKTPELVEIMVAAEAKF